MAAIGTVRVRPYVEADREVCLEVFDSNVPGSFRSWERDGFAGFLDDLPGPFLVLEDKAGEVLGCGGVAAEPDGSGSLCWGMVRRDRQGEGLGRLLLEARVERLLALEGVRTVRLETIPETTGFFKRMGFQVVEREPDGYAPGMDRVVLVKEVAVP